MITRSKLAEQLREYQKRSQHKYSALTVFSPKPYVKSWFRAEKACCGLYLEHTCPIAGGDTSFLDNMDAVCTYFLEGSILLLRFPRGDIVIASLWASLFCVILVSSYICLYFRFFRLSFVIVCFGVLLPIRLRNSRKKLARKRDLPLSM